MLFGARVLGGVSAGMAYPTTLALITALWSGAGRTIALWSAIGGAIASLGPLISGALLEQFDWGSVFLITLPLVAVAGVVSVMLVAALILAINFAPVPGRGALALGFAAFFLFPGKDEEQALLARYEAEDTPRPAEPPRAIA